MSISPYNPSDRYRKRKSRRYVNILFYILLSVTVFWAGMWLGGLKAQQSLYIIQRENDDLVEERDRTQKALTDLRVEAQTATVRLNQLKTTYSDVLSDGPKQKLFDLLSKQIDKGVDLKRLESVIISARPPQNCTSAQTKRFVVKTPAHQGPESYVSVAEGAVKLYAAGESARNTRNEPESWYDAGQPVTWIFDIAGQDITSKEGALPLYHSIILEDKEYRFTLTEGARSFVNVTFDSCDHP